MVRLACLSAACLSVSCLSVACDGGSEPSVAPDESSAVGAPDSSSSLDAAGETSDASFVGRELPGSLVAQLRLEGADADGRLLTLAPGFIATAECSDCGAPRYLSFLAVRCADERHCEVLTDGCQGSISRDDGGRDDGGSDEGDRFTVELAAIEGEGTPEQCEGYSGVFESVAGP